MKKKFLHGYKVQCWIKSEFKTMNQIPKLPLRMSSLVVVHCIRSEIHQTHSEFPNEFLRVCILNNELRCDTCNEPLSTRSSTLKNRLKSPMHTANKKIMRESLAKGVQTTYASEIKLFFTVIYQNDGLNSQNKRYLTGIYPAYQRF